MDCVKQSAAMEWMKINSVYQPAHTQMFYIENQIINNLIVWIVFTQPPACNQTFGP